MTTAGTPTRRASTRFFVSYAQKDEPLAGQLVEDLQTHMAISSTYDYRLWRDTVLLAGERWREEIDAALADCDVGLLLISPRFLGSRFIRDVELPALIAEAASPIVPVMLRAVSFDHQTLHGLGDFQIYRWQSPTFQKRSYSECRGVDRERFALELFEQIERRLNKLTGRASHA